MRRAFMRVFPWDLLANGVPDALDRLQGEVGLGGVTLWASCAPGAYARVRGEPGVFRFSGGLLFSADPARYDMTRCKPQVSAWARDRDVFRAAADGCRDRGLEFRALFSAAHAPHVARKHPEFSTKNAFGQESTEHLCPLNPDVWSYLASLVTEVAARYSPDEMVIRDVSPCWPEARMPSVMGDAPLDVASRDLLSLCFCESCLQRAGAEGLDAASLRRATAEAIVAASNAAPTADQLRNALTGGLRAYRDSQRAAVGRLLADITERAGRPVVVDHDVIDPVSFDDEEMSAGARHMATLDDEDAKVLWAAARGFELRIPAVMVAGERGRSLVGRLPEAATRGLGAVEFDHYGLFSDAALTAVKQAVRFARRSVISA